MLSYVTLALAALFLPLFPFSMVFNLLLSRVRRGWQRGLVILLWPHIGIGLLHVADIQVPPWVAIWGVLTALLYAARALGLRDMGAWMGFIVTSSWALLWVAEAFGPGGELTHLYAVSFAVPLVLFALLGEGLTRRYGAAYTGLYVGLASSLPRFSLVLVLVVLAAVATPLFPGFFAMLALMLETIPHSAATAVALALVWLLWSGAGMRLLTDLIVGQPGSTQVADLGYASTSGFLVGLGLLVIAGLYLVGGMS